MWQKAKEKLQLARHLCVINMCPATQSNPCIQQDNPIHHSLIIHPSVFHFLTNSQPSSALLLAVVPCVCFPLS